LKYNELNRRGVILCREQMPFLGQPTQAIVARQHAAAKRSSVRQLVTGGAMVVCVVRTEIVFSSSIIGFNFENDSIEGRIFE
jgi:hypothetical protein